ncbi:MAG: hypothetical protein WDM89_10000 [Rhizomicrobium sp.]
MRQFADSLRCAHFGLPFAPQLLELPLTPGNFLRFDAGMKDITENRVKISLSEKSRSALVVSIFMFPPVSMPMRPKPVAKSMRDTTKSSVKEN